MLDNPHARREVALRVVKDSSQEELDPLARDVLGSKTQVRLGIPLEDPATVLRHVEMAADEFKLLLLALREEIKRPGCRPVDILALTQRRIMVLHKRMNPYRVRGKGHRTE